MNTFTQGCQRLLAVTLAGTSAITCLSLVGCGSDTASPSAAVTAPAIEMETQSSYQQGNQPLREVVNQVQQNYQTQLQTGLQP